MVRARRWVSNSKWGLVMWLVWAAAASAHAQTAQPHAIPRTLRDGAPTQRIPNRASKPPVPVTQRATPTPSITFDRRDLVQEPDHQRRSLALLQREISVLKRLLSNMERPGDPKRADVLLRLAQDYQELMWIQRVQLNLLMQQGHANCSCRAVAEPQMVACADTPN